MNVDMLLKGIFLFKECYSTHNCNTENKKKKKNINHDKHDIKDKVDRFLKKKSKKKTRRRSAFWYNNFRLSTLYL